MKKLFFAAVAIAMTMLTSCRQDDAELKNEENPYLKKTEKTNESTQKLENPTDTTGIGPVVTIPPR